MNVFKHIFCKHTHIILTKDLNFQDNKCYKCLNCDRKIGFLKAFYPKLPISVLEEAVVE